ncbi:phosphate propanoyltransferase [Amphibacillus sp. Q70]|uniref:phosphate propanoyltransferase n=1 Tax=Amphibacillus sp. Q70 TaxID=3453416 RepID=UPI003F83C7EF
MKQISDEQLVQLANMLLHKIEKKDRSTNEVTGNREVSNKIPIGVSNRHIHLSETDIEELFGPSYQLTPLRSLSQPGQFAAKEVLTIVGSKGSIHNVRVLGPARKQSQIEISKTDAFKLGIKPPINESGDLNEAASLYVVGPEKSLHFSEKVIIAKRHIHMTPADAKRFALRDKQTVAIKVHSERPSIYLDTVVRVSENFCLECHLDTDEANAADVASKDCYVEIVEGL